MWDSVFQLNLFYMRITVYENSSNYGFLHAGLFER